MAIVRSIGRSRFQRALHAAGLAGLSVSPAFGGHGLPAAYETAWREEAGRFPLMTEQLSITLGNCLPTLLEFGTDAQRRRHVPRILAGREVWCQLFSEPGAGSDIAGVQTRAVPVPGGWLVNGQKVWTTLAHRADFGILLARTDPSAPKHDGLSMFIVDLARPGVEIRPIRQLDGAMHFDEVFLTDVFVPADAVLPPAGAGWRIASAMLHHQRVARAAGQRGGVRHDRTDRLLAELPAPRATDPVVRDDLVRLYIAEVCQSLLVTRSVAAAATRAPIRVRSVRSASSPTPSSPGSSPTWRGGSSAPTRWHGPDRRSASPGTIEPGAQWATDALFTLSLSIAGGTNEIQRSIIAERVLGLPREPAVADPARPQCAGRDLAGLIDVDALVEDRVGVGAGRPRREHRRVQPATAGDEQEDVIGRRQRRAARRRRPRAGEGGFRSRSCRAGWWPGDAARIARRSAFNPARPSTAAWSGLRATATIRVRKNALFEPGLAIARATSRSRRCGESGSSASSTNTTECGASTPITVTTESNGSKPASTEHAGHGDWSTSSVRHIVNLPPCPSSAMSETPGRAPPMFSRHSRTARPIDALARWPGPSAPKPPAIPHASASGPLTTTSGVVECVVLWASNRSYSGRSSARSVAMTIGMWSGSQPAITVLIATFSMVVAEFERAHHAEARRRVLDRREHHALDPRRRRDHDRQAVGAAEAVQLREGVGLVDGVQQCSRMPRTARCRRRPHRGARR